jgi:hypothetical protein
MNDTLIVILILICIAIGAIWLQLFFSSRTNKWYGFILPMIAFLISIIYVLNIVDTGRLWNNLAMVVLTFFLTNIPTIVLLIIYFSCRDKLKRKAQLEKMEIQDFE